MNRQHEQPGQHELHRQPGETSQRRRSAAGSAGLFRRLVRRASATAGDDRGVTLVELMVTMVVTALVAALTAALVIGVQQTNQENVSRQDQIDEARVAVRSMSKTLRAAVTPSQLATNCLEGAGCSSGAFTQASGTGVQFYSNLDNADNSRGPSRVTYVLATTGPQAGELVETVQRPDSATPGASGYTYCTRGAGCEARISSRVLARGVQSAAPVLRYFDTAGGAISVSAGANLSAEQLRSVLSVELTVSVQASGSSAAEPTTYIQRILLPNAQSLIKTGTE